MKFYRLLSIFLVLIAIACLAGVQGQFQYVAPSSGYPTVAPSVAQKPLLPPYTMPKVAPIIHISAPVPFNFHNKTPYMSNPNAGANSLWIEGATNWTQYVSVSQGTNVTLAALSPTNGSGYINEIFAGLMYNLGQKFYASSQLTFYAGPIGRHTLYTMINGQPSSPVVIDVVPNTYSNYPAPNIYGNYPPSTNYNPMYYPMYYPVYSPWEDYNPVYSSDLYPVYYQWDYYYGQYPWGFNL